MRHNVKKGLKLGTDASHTKAMKKSLAKALFENDRIKTTETRAKALRSVVDPIITWAKKGDLHSRRLAIAKLGDKQLVAEIFDKAAQLFCFKGGNCTVLFYIIIFPAMIPYCKILSRLKGIAGFLN